MSRNLPKVVCGIVGGVGPMAGVKLHEKIIQFTPTNGTDQSHFCVHHVSQSQYIPDRTKFLLREQKTNENGQRGEANSESELRPSSDVNTNPAYGATQAVKNLIQSTPRYHTLLVGVPCNTFHAPEIWNVFEAGIETYVHGKTKTDFASPVQIKTLHMIDETIRYIQRVLYDDEKEFNENKPARIGLLSTEGTRDTRIYHNRFQQLNELTNGTRCNVISLCDAMQEKLSNVIYNEQYGIKAQSTPVNSRALSGLRECCDHLIREYGCEIIILGCTELPLALPATNCYQSVCGKQPPVRLVDPVETLAKAFVSIKHQMEMKSTFANNLLAPLQVRESLRQREIENALLSRAQSLERKRSIALCSNDASGC